MVHRALCHRRFALLWPLVLVALHACSGGGDAPDGAARDGAAIDARGDASGTMDAPTPPTDAAVVRDGAAADDATLPVDAALVRDGATTADADTCTCDVTVLCDRGCACDVACSVVPGAPPLGDDAVLFERAEIAIFHPAQPGGAIDRVSLRDDAFTGAGGPSPAHRTLLAAQTRASLAARPSALAADVDGDGRDEVVLATPTAIVAEDWNGSALAPRSVRSFAASSFVDVAAGDLDGNGSRVLVVSRQTGTTLTIEALALAATGAATVRASLTVPSIARHALAIGRPAAGQRPELYVLLAAASNPGTLERLRVQRYTLGASAFAAGASLDLGGECLTPRTATDEGMTLAVGNLDADAASELAFGVYCDGGELHVGVQDPGAAFVRRLISSRALDADVARTGGFRPLLAIGRVGTTAQSTPMVVLGNSPRNGVGPRAEVATLELRADRLNAYGTEQLSGAEANSVLTSLAVRDVDRDGTDEIVAGFVDVAMVDTIGRPCDQFAITCEMSERGALVQVHERDFAGAPVELLRTSGGARTLGPGVVVAVGDLDADSMRVRATGNVYLHTGDPFVNAVIAAPPTWLGRAGVAHADGSGTSFGTATSMGTSDTRTVNASASVTVSAGASFGLVEFSAGVTASVEFSASTTQSRTVSYGRQTSVGDDADLVLFRTVPYASHEYRVVAHPNAAQIGSLITVDVPGTMIETVRTLAGFRAAYGALADAIVPPALFAHRVGDPTSYPAPGACTQPAIAARVGGGTVRDVMASPALVDVGSASSGANTQTMSVAMQTGRATSVALGVSMSVGVGAGGVSVETSVGVGAGFTHETTVGRDVSYAGTVGYLASGYGVSTRYEWGLCVFHYERPGRGAYPVVGYVVRR